MFLFYNYKDGEQVVRFTVKSYHLTQIKFVLDETPFTPKHLRVSRSHVFVP